MDKWRRGAGAGLSRNVSGWERRGGDGGTRPLPEAPSPPPGLAEAEGRFQTLSPWFQTLSPSGQQYSIIWLICFSQSGRTNLQTPLTPTESQLRKPKVRRR